MAGRRQPSYYPLLSAPVRGQVPAPLATEDRGRSTVARIDHGTHQGGGRYNNSGSGSR